MGFDLDKWIADLRNIPEKDFHKANMAIIREHDRREALPELRRQANEKAREYYELPIHKKTKKGVHVWVQPPAPVIGYPSGMRVWHERNLWECIAPEPTTDVPAEGSESWALVTPPVDPAEDSEGGEK